MWECWSEVGKGCCAEGLMCSLKRGKTRDGEECEWCRTTHQHQHNPISIVLSELSQGLWNILYTSGTAVPERRAGPCSDGTSTGSTDESPILDMDHDDFDIPPGSSMHQSRGYV